MHIKTTHRFIAILLKELQAGTIILTALPGVLMQQANAASECGAGPTVSCNNTGTPAANANPYANGISYTGQNVNLTLTSGSVVDTTGGTLLPVNNTSTVAIGVGVPTAVTAGTASLTVETGASVTISQNNVYGLVIRGSSTSASSSATVVNHGNVTMSGTSARAIYTFVNGPVDITNTGEVASTNTGTSTFGIYGQSSTANHAVSITNSGTVQTSAANASSTGINAATSGTGALTIVQSGDVQTGGTGVGMIGGTGTGSLINSGTTKGEVTGVSIAGLNSTVTNTGTMQGTTGNGLKITSGTMNMTNSGAGLVTGATGISLQSNGNQLTNTATITGTGGTAIALTGNDNTLILDTGSVLNGNAVSSGTGNTLTLQGNGTNRGDLSGFSTISMNGTAWELAGATSTTSPTATATTISSGTLIVSGTLNNQGAGGGTSIANSAQLQLGNGGSSGSVTGDIANHGMLSFDRADTLTSPGTISGSGSVTQLGAGTTILTADNTYTGATTITAGALQLGNGGTTGSIAGTSSVTDNATLVFDRADAMTFAAPITGTGMVQQTGSGTTILTADNTYSGGTTITAGTLRLCDGGCTGSLDGNVTNNATLAVNRADAITLAGVISGSGAVQQSGAGTTTLSSINTYSGGTTISAGTLSGSATSFGSGPILNNAALIINTPGNASFANVLSGTGSFTNSGAGTLTLTGAGSSAGTTTVAEGTLAFAQSGAFTSDSYVTGTGATTSIGGASQLAVTDTFTQAAGSTLAVTLGSNNPIITAGTAALDGTLSVAGISAVAPSSASALPAAEFTVIHTACGITGDFSAVSLGNTTSPVDYLTLAGTLSADSLNYNVGLGLTWQAGATVGNGGFTLTSPTSTFNVDLALADQAASATSWNGKDLTKDGAGTLTLSALNSYTGLTTVNGGTLSMGFANAFAASSAVTVNSGATLALNDFTQTTNNLSGAGAISLGSLATTVLIASNDATSTTFSGAISGAGDLTKTGAGTLTLSGANTYAGGTTLNTGTLVATNGNALGTGVVSNSAALQLDFASAGTLANTLSGTGSLTKTGAGTATLSATGSSQGTVSVDAGTLQFSQTGTFNAATYTTQAGATTAIGGASQLAVTGAFTEAAGSVLEVKLGSNSPIITAGTASLNGTLSITGFAASAPASASTLTSTAFTVVHTTSGITGGFSSFNLGGAASPVDYLKLAGIPSADSLNYNVSVGLGLTWQAGATLGNGVFTLANAADAFNVDVALSNQAASATGWNGADLTKNGAGTLMLSALNPYTGLTTINGGTLAMGIANAFAASSAVTISGGATLAMNGFAQVANNLSGAGSIVTDATTLTTNNTVNTTFSGAISGAGSLAKTGAAVLTLSGVNTYAGGSTISAGELSGSAASFGTGAILDNASLVINQPTNASFANALNGTGSFTKSGAGSLDLTGTGTLSGATTVAAGRLAVNGSLAHATITVQNGAILGGSGTAGQTAILAGGTIAPGNSIGTLTVNGAFAQTAGSIYQVEVDPGSTAADQIRVDGAATLAPGAILDVVKFVPGAYSANSRYTVLTATDGVTGTYRLTGDVSGAFYALTDSYDLNNVYLNAVQVRNFADAAQTPNQIATARALQNLPNGNPVMTALTTLATVAEARHSFDQLSGEIHASIKTALVENSHYIRDVAVDRVRQSFCMPVAANQIVTAPLRTPAAAATASDQCAAAPQAKPVVWAHALGAWGQVNGNGNAATLRQNSGGFLAGADTTLAQQWRVGALAGYTGGNFNVDDRHASAGNNNYHAGLYGGTQSGNLGIRAGAAYTWHSINTTRSPAFTGYADNLKDSYNARTAQVFGDIGYRMAVRQVTLEPFASVAYVNLHTSSVNEQGGAAALAGESGNTNSTFTTTGIRGAIDFALGRRTVVTASGTLGWRHALGSVTPASTLAFGGGSPFVVTGVPIGRHAALVEAALDFQIMPTASAGITYGGQFGSGIISQAVQGTVKMRF